MEAWDEMLKVSARIRGARANVEKWFRRNEEFRLKRKIDTKFKLKSPKDRQQIFEILKESLKKPEPPIG